MDERDVIFQAKEVENLINAIARDTNEARMAAAQDDILEMQEEESKQEKQHGANSGQISQDYLPLL